MDKYLSSNQNYTGHWEKLCLLPFMFSWSLGTLVICIGDETDFPTKILSRPFILPSEFSLKKGRSLLNYSSGKKIKLEKL